MIAFVDSLGASLPAAIDVTLTENGYVLATFVTDGSGAIPAVPVVGAAYVADFAGSRAPQGTVAFTGDADPQTVLVTGYVAPAIVLPVAPTVLTSATPGANPAATRTDMALVYGGFVQFTAAGDLALVQDVPGSPAATAQHVEFGVRQAPRLVDAAGNVVAPADDPAHPDRGAGLRRYLGAPNSETARSTIRAASLRTLATLDGVASAPAPSVTVTQYDRRTIAVAVAATSESGDPLAVPSIAITDSSGG